MCQWSSRCGIFLSSLILIKQLQERVCENYLTILQTPGIVLTRGLLHLGKYPYGDCGLLGRKWECVWQWLEVVCEWQCHWWIKICVVIQKRSEEEVPKAKNLNLDQVLIEEWEVIYSVELYWIFLQSVVGSRERQSRIKDYFVLYLLA